MFLVVAAVVVIVPAAMSWWSARLMAQLTPIEHVRWEGYIIVHDLPTYPNELLLIEAHHIRVLRGAATILDTTYDVPLSFGEGPIGFLAGLQVDDDEELEVVFCQAGVVENYIEPDRSTGVLAVQPGRYAAPAVHELCADVDTAGSRPRA